MGFVLVVALSAPMDAGAQAARETVWALAPSNLDSSDLGLAVDGQFNALGERAAISRDVRTTRGNNAEVEIVRRDNELRVRASAGAYGAELTGQFQRSETSGYIRAQHIERIDQLPADVELTVLRNDHATYYISAIRYGRMIERHFWGSERTVEAAIAANIAGQGSASFSVTHNDRSYGEHFTQRGYAVDAASEAGVFASGQADSIARRLRPDGPAVPILVAYTRLPSNEALANLDRTVQIELSDWRIPARRPNNLPWDATGPDPLVVLTLGGRVICRAAAMNVDTTDGLWAVARGPQDCGEHRLRPNDYIDVDFFEQEPPLSPDRVGSVRVSGEQLRDGQTEWEVTAGANSRVTAMLHLVQAHPAAPAAAGIAAAGAGVINQSHTGSLAAGDAVNTTDGSFQDDYTINVERGWVVTATLSGARFDPYVWIIPPNGDGTPPPQRGSAPGAHAVTLTHTAAISGSFVVRANSIRAGETGDYTLQITTGPAGSISPVRVTGIVQQGVGRADHNGYGFDHGAFATVLQQRIPQMTVCYEQGLASQPSMQGQLTLRFVLMPDGLIRDVEPMPSGITTDVANCIADVVRALRLLQGGPPERTQYTFPYTLRPGAQAAPPAPSQPAPAGPGVRQYQGTMQGSSDPGLPPGTICTVRVEPVATSAHNCRVFVDCGGRSLYGGGTSGYNICQADGSASDPRMDDGDPALALAPGQGSVTVTTPNASYRMGIR